MRNELEDKLFNEFPEFFKHRENLKTSLMGFGFACGDGWFDLIYKLMKDIKAVYNTEKEYFHVVQVKEKFAGLRFYVTGASSEVFDLIHAAEDESYKICEGCGKPGIMRIRSNWYKTLCEECAGDEWVKEIETSVDGITWVNEHEIEWEDHGGCLAFQGNRYHQHQFRRFRIYRHGNWESGKPKYELSAHASRHSYFVVHSLPEENTTLRKIKKHLVESYPDHKFYEFASDKPEHWEFFALKRKGENT